MWPLRNEVESSRDTNSFLPRLLLLRGITSAPDQNSNHSRCQYIIIAVVVIIVIIIIIIITIIVIIITLFCSEALHLALTRILITPACP